MRGFKHTNTCWRESTAEHKPSRRLLEGTVENFLLQVIEEPRRDPKQDLILTNKEDLVGNVKPKGRLGCRDHEKAQLEIPGTTRRKRR